jgi:hypothetical protein
MLPLTRSTRSLILHRSRPAILENERLAEAQGLSVDLEHSLAARVFDPEVVAD